MNTAVRTLKEWAGQEVVSGLAGRRAVGVAALVLATAAGAYVAVPLPWTPVPMTLQPLFVLLAGVLLGPRLGAVAMGSYVLLGAAGLPVFSNGHAGIPWLLGPTGGYLLAYPAAAFVAGWLAGGPASGALRVLGALVAGLGVIYLGGVSQLLVLTGESPERALALGVLPFLGGDLLKILIALAIARPVRRKSLGRF